MITRRSVLRSATATVIGGAVASALPLRAWSAEKPVNIAIGGFTFAYLPLLTAVATGHMKAEGLDVSLIQTGSGTNTMAAMLGGSVDVAGLVMSDVILAAAKGQKMSAFSPLMSQYASDAVISKKAAEKVGLKLEMPLKERMARLKGLTLAISGRGSGTDKLWRYLLQIGGLDPEKDVSLTVIKLNEMYTALRAGHIDGFNVTAPANNQAVEDGFAVWAARPSHGEVPGIKDFLYTVLCGRPDYLNSNGDVAAALVRGMAKASVMIQKDPKAAGEALHAKFYEKMNIDLIKRTVVDQAMTVMAPPTLTEEQFRHNIAFESMFVETVKSVGYKQVIDPRFLPKA